MKRLLSVPLGTISVDAGAAVALTVEEVFQGVRPLLGLHKHQSQRVLACSVGRENSALRRGTLAATGSVARSQRGSHVKGFFLAGRRFLTCGIEKVEQEGPLVGLFHPDHFLGDVLRGGADTAHGQENVILQEITCKDLFKKNKKTRNHLLNAGLTK